MFDLGKQVPMNTILEKAKEVGADAIGLSALLVSTSKQMPICVQEQDARGLRFPIVVGGAAINREFGRRISLLDEGQRWFEPGLFYAKDAFEGLEIMDVLTGEPARDATHLSMAKRMRRSRPRQRAKQRAALPKRSGTARATLKKADVPRAPFLGPRTLPSTTSTCASCGRASISRASTVYRGAAPT